MSAEGRALELAAQGVNRRPRHKSARGLICWRSCEAVVLIYASVLAGLEIRRPVLVRRSCFADFGGFRRDLVGQSCRLRHNRAV